MTIASLAEVREAATFGGKAAGLGAAIRAGFPVPDGVALSFSLVDSMAKGADVPQLAEILSKVEVPLAVRSSAIGEDGSKASFAGQHLTVLNVCSEPDLVAAVRRVAASARSPEAIAYRKRMGIEGEARMGVVVQHLVQAECAGVLFTKNPMTGKDERVIEAAWGLGEAVVAGIVTPDRYRLDRQGTLLEQSAGEKDVAIRPSPRGGVEQVSSEDHEVYALCLNQARLARLVDLAARCESYQNCHYDLEWAFEGDTLYLLQWRPITR